MQKTMLEKEATGAIAPQDVTIVVPTWNEVQAIGQVIDEITEYGYKNILVVDGYSTDGTAEAAQKKGVRVVNQTGRGKTGALATAVQYVETPYILVMDGDCTYDPSCIDKLTAHARTYDEVIGARTYGREHIPMLNRLGNRFISWFFKVMFAVNLTDVCSGMYLIRTQAAKKLEFTTGGFDVEVEIAAQFADDGKVTEVPVNYRPRVGRQKLSSLKHGFTIATSILRLANLHNPVVLYAGFVAMSIIPALAVLGWVAYERIYLGFWHSGYAIVGLLLLILSLQSLAVATISLLIKRSEQRIYRTLKTGYL
jgi:dolichol-phosphate mannosyltransferase